MVREDYGVEGVRKKVKGLMDADNSVVITGGIRWVEVKKDKWKSTIKNKLLRTKTAA